MKEGLTPLEYMLGILRDEDQAQDARYQAAKDAAPYLHPRLSAVEASGPNGSPLIPAVAIEFVDKD